MSELLIAEGGERLSMAILTPSFDFAVEKTKNAEQFNNRVT